MRETRILGTLLVAAAGSFLIGAAKHPIALAKTSPGVWEISGLPGAKAPIRQCVADMASLARLEHRGQNCRQTVVSDRPASTTIHYTCGQNGFGQSKMTLITPRSLRIETQGISASYPFNYVIQARRVANCNAH